MFKLQPDLRAEARPTFPLTHGTHKKKQVRTAHKSIKERRGRPCEGRLKMDGWTDGFILEGLNMWKLSVAVASHRSYYCRRTGALAFPRVERAANVSLRSSAP